MMANQANRAIDTKTSIILAGLCFSRSSINSLPAQRSNAKFLSLAFWKAFWLTMRPYLIFVSGAAGLVGLSFLDSPKPARILLAFFPLLFSYGLGQALTDCFQTDTDALSSPYRPLVQGVITRKQVLSTSLAGLLLGIIILTSLNPFIPVLGTVAVLGLLGYTFFKKRWWGGPFWNSWIVALIPIIGIMTGEHFYFSDLASLSKADSLAFFFAVLAILFGYGNFVVMGYLKDIFADRQTGYRTFPVVFGWKATAIYSDVLALAAGIFTGLALFGIRTFLPGLVFFFAAVTVNIYAQIDIHRIRDERKAHGPIANVVRAFVLYALAIVVALHIEWLPFVILFYLIFETALKYRPEKTQV
jgi:4-hydroxybenzoate polyprenyltransferase